MTATSIGKIELSGKYTNAVQADMSTASTPFSQDTLQDSENGEQGGLHSSQGNTAFDCRTATDAAHMQLATTWSPKH
jgi:hypothetical protein